MKIKIFTTGGTIDKIYFDQKSDYQVGDPQANSVLQRANVTFPYEIESIMRKDSLDMTDDDRALIRETLAADKATKIILTHGTDAMVRTAEAIQGISDKVIVLTGSMYPAQFRDSDAVFNIGCAVAGCQTLSPGVYIAMNGRIFDALKIRKNVEKNCFEELS